MPFKADYFDLEKRMSRVFDQLSETLDPRERSLLLGEAAALEGDMAGMHLKVFGPAPNEDEAGRDLAESMRYSALLLDLLADVELAVATDGRRRDGSSWLEPFAGRWLTRMASTVPGRQRMALLRDLYDAVEPHVGGQAAELLAGIAFDGRCGYDGSVYLPNSFPKMVRTLWRAWRESRAA